MDHKPLMMDAIERLGDRESVRIPQWSEQDERHGR